MKELVPISIVIPTYQREQVLLKTIEYLQKLNHRPAEIIVVDQTLKHKRKTEQQLNLFDKNGIIRWIKLQRPSIPHAMNTGLLQARHEIVLFLDDDIIPDENLVAAHVNAHSEKDTQLVAGRVIQPWDSGYEQEEFGTFYSSYKARQWVGEFMGGNFSVNRSVAMKIGGFDENFVKVAYRFERDFADRIIISGGKVLFEPDAVIRHLKVSHGGTRSYGEHLTTIKPSHSVGEYYYLLRSKIQKQKWLKLILRPFQSIKTRHHLHRPWWIPVTFTSEILGFLWAVCLNIRGPKYISGH